MPYSDKAKQAAAVADWQDKNKYRSRSIKMGNETWQRFCLVAEKQGGKAQAMRWLLDHAENNP